MISLQNVDNGIPFFSDIQEMEGYELLRNVLQVIIQKKGYEDQSVSLSIGTYVVMSFLYSTPVDDYPKRFRDEIRVIKEDIVVRYDMRKQQRGFDTTLYIKEKKVKEVEVSVEMDIVEYMDIGNFQTLEDIYGRNFHDYVRHMSSLGMDYMYRRDITFTLEDFFFVENIFTRYDIEKAYYMVVLLFSDFDACKVDYGVNLLKCLNIVDVFLMIKVEKSSDVRASVISDACSKVGVPFYQEAYVTYLQSKKITDYVGSSIRKAMYVSIIEDSPYVDSILAHHLGINIIDDFFILVYQELQDLPFTGLSLDVFLDNPYQHQMNKYAVYGDPGNCFFQECEFLIVYYGNLSNLQLIIMSQVSITWNRVVRKHLYYKACDSSWLPEVGADRGWDMYHDRCMFHHDFEDCNHSPLDDGEHEMVSDSYQVLKFDGIKTVLDNCAWISRESYSLFHRFPFVSTPLVVVTLCNRYGYREVRHLFRLKNKYGVCEKYINDVFKYLAREAKRDVMYAYLTWEFPKVLDFYTIESPSMFLMRHMKDRHQGNDDISDNMYNAMDDYEREEKERQVFADAHKVCLCCLKECPVKVYYECMENNSDPEWTSPTVTKEWIVRKDNGVRTLIDEYVF